MATRKKKKQRTMQLMASAALLSTTVAPYVISAEELTNNQLDLTNAAEQNALEAATQTTGDAANISLQHENTIGNESEITSSGGNTSTESIDNGIPHSTTVTGGEAINNSALTTLPTEAVTEAQTNIIWRQSVNYTVQADPTNPIADSSFSNAEVVRIGTAYYIQLSLTESASDFKTIQYIDEQGNKHDVEVVQSETDTRIIRMPLIQDEHGVSKLYIDSESYGAHTLLFNFDLSELEENVAEEQQSVNAGESDSEQSNVVAHSFTAVEVQAGTFGSVPGSFIEGYLAPYFTNATVVTVDGQKYIEMTLIGKGYGVVEFGGAELVSSVGEKMDQVRVFRIPAAKVSTHRINAGDYGIYDLTFTFDVTDEQIAPEPIEPEPVAPEVVAPEQSNVVAHSFTAVEVQQGIYGSVGGGFIDNYLKPYFTNATVVTIDGQKYIEMTLIGKGYGVVEFGGAELVSSVGEKMEQVRVFRIPAAKVSTHRINAGDYGIYDLTFTFDVTDEQIAPEPIEPEPVAPEVVAPEQSNVVAHSFTSVEVQQGIYGSVGGGFIDNYLKPYFTNATVVTIDGQKYIEMTLIGKGYGVVEFGGAELVSSVGEKMEQVRVFRIPAAKVSTHRINAGDYGIYDLTFTFDVTDEQLDLTNSGESGNTTIPDGGESGNTTIPDGGESGNTTDPNGGESGNTTNPDGGESGNTTNPDGGESGNTTIPDGGDSGNTTIPDGGESSNTTNPDGGESGNTTIPDGGESGNTTIPDGGESGNTTNPDGGESGNTTNPDGGESGNTTDPNGGESGNTTNPELDSDVIQPPAVPANPDNVIITKPEQLNLAINESTPITFNFDVPEEVAKEVKEVLATLAEMIPEPTIEVNENKQLKVKFDVKPNANIKQIRVLRYGKELTRWENVTTARLASLASIATTNNTLEFTTDSLEGITFEVTDAQNTTVKAAPAVEIAQSVTTSTTGDTATVTPGESGSTTNPETGNGSGNTANPDTGNNPGNTTNPDTGNNPGNTTNPDTGNNSGNATKPETPTAVEPINITHSFTATEVKAGIYGSVGGGFIENYLKPYFTNAQLVTIDGKKYIEMTLIGKGYGVVSFENATLVSSVGEKMDQVRVFRIPAAKVSTHEIDAGDYGIYDLTFTFGVTDAQLADAPGENTTPTTPATPAPATPDIPAPKAPAAPTTNEIVKDILKFKLNTATNILFALDTNKELAKAVSEMIKESKAKRISATELEITFKIEKKPTVKRITFFQNGKKLGEWTAPKVARIASLIPFFANTTEAVTLNVASTEGITFEVEETNGTVTTIGTAVEAKKADLATTTTVKPVAPGGNVITGNFGTVTNREPISYKMVGDPNGPMADFMTNYMNPFFSNAELVTVDGKNYIEMTLTGKAYGFQNLRVTGGYKVISSVGEKMDQVRVIRFPANKNVTIHVDSGELGYGAYDLLFTFNLSEEQMKNAAAAGTGGITPVQTITPQIVSEGDVKFTIPAASSAIVTYAKKISSKLVDGKYNVSLTLMTETDLETFVVKQGDKEIARWDKKAKSASLTKAANSNVLTFTVESLDDLTLIASTKNRTLEAKLLGEPVKKQEEVVPQATKDGRTPMSYTMEADPNGPMADFISNYLAPYFSNAVYVLENDKEYVELTLTGKAYGFQKLQYIDANGKNVDIEVVSSKGEKMDQVRIVRLPLIQDKNGITKIFVDSGDLGYGAYTLFFKFNVPAKSANTETAKPAVTNPFKDIDGVYSKDDILALYAAGITTGTTETTYSPNANMTRAQFAVMVARALGVSSTNETKFKDVQGKWYAKEVQALVEIGIITGVSDTKFKPNDKITRQQAAVMIHRMLAHQGYTNTATVADLNFKDSAKISDYAKEAFAELQAQGVMTGFEGKVNPNQNLTRAQMAKILKNAADLVGLLD